MTGFGEIADGINALISLGRGDVAGAALSTVSMQWNKTGGIDDANDDFDSLNLQNVKEIPGGRTGKLPDGRKINVRDHSSDGRPTLEIQDGKNKIKIRYGE